MSNEADTKPVSVRLADALRTKSEIGEFPSEIVIQNHYGDDSLTITEWWFHEGRLHIAVQKPE